MFRIGTFAHLGGVSVRTLRHYDDLGLLRPAALSEGGYRLYVPGQLTTLRRITTLKAFGCTLEEIRRLLSGERDEPFGQFLTRKRGELLTARHDLDARLIQLDQAIEQETRVNSYTVQLKTMPGQTALIARGPASDYRHVTAPMEQLYAQVCGTMNDHALPDPGWSVVTWRGGGYQSEAEIELEVALPIFGDAPDRLRPGVRLAHLPELLVAATIHLGSYERFGEAYAALLAWMDLRGFVPTGPVREVYLRHSDGADGQISELQVPVRPA